MDRSCAFVEKQDPTEMILYIEMFFELFSDHRGITLMNGELVRL